MHLLLHPISFSSFEEPRTIAKERLNRNEADIFRHNFEHWHSSGPQPGNDKKLIISILGLSIRFILI